MTAVKTVAGFEEREFLRLAASLEKSSEHPLALAVVEAARERDIPLAEASEFDSPASERSGADAARPWKGQDV